MHDTRRLRKNDGVPARRSALTVVALVALAAPASALAHANLRLAAPAVRARLGSSPARIRLVFDQPVKAFANSIVVQSERGRIVSAPARNGGDSREVVTTLRFLPRGAYTVRWQALSADGHVVAGLYTFGVRMAAPPPTEAFGTTGPTRAEQLVRWGYFSALALLIGGLGFRLLVLPAAVPIRVQRRFYLTTGIGAAALLELGILSFFLRAEDVLRLPFTRFLDSDLSPIAAGTRYGTAFIVMTLGFAFVAALLFLAWLGETRWLLWCAFGLSLAFSSGLSLSGHSAVDPGSSWKSELADWVHLSAAMLWVGGLVQLALTVWPLAPKLRRSAFRRFSRVASLLLLALLSGGIYLSLVRFPRLADLWRFEYGRVLLLKLALVAVAVAWGAVHHFLVASRLVTQSAPPSSIRNSLLGESTVAITVLLLTATLVNTAPPPPLTPPPPAQAAGAHAAGTHLP